MVGLLARRALVFCGSANRFTTAGFRRCAVSGRRERSPFRSGMRNQAGRLQRISGGRCDRVLSARANRPEIVGRPPWRAPAFTSNAFTHMKHRQLRVNELVKRELSGIIAREINFEGALVSINAVDVAPDLKSAHVFVSTLGTENGASMIAKLEVHRPALQAELSRHVVLKYTPHLIF